MQVKIIVSKFRLGFLVERERPKKPRKGKIRSLSELKKRRKWLVKLKERIEKEIENGEGNLAEQREELGWLKTVIAEYQFIFKEIE